MGSDLSDGSYYAEGRVVRKAPLSRKRDDGTTSITIGFPVCTISEYLADDAAATLAELLNIGTAHAPEEAP